MNINANNVSAIASTPAWCPSWKPWPTISRWSLGATTMR